MKTTRASLGFVLVALLIALAGPAIAAAPPDYKTWGELLSKYYDPAKGMNYKALKAQDKPALDELRRQLAQVDVQALSRQDQLAYWINLYNVNVVAIVVEGYPVESIRDLSTDPLIRLNVFKKDVVDTKRGKVSLNDIENDQIRNGFKDPRIHFAINCAARSCPPIRTEPYVGSRISEQLDDQVRKFLNGPNGVRLGKKGSTLVVHVTKIMSWFGEDFQRWWSVDPIGFVVRYVSSEKRKQIESAANQIAVEFDDYDWKLNDASK